MKRYLAAAALAAALVQPAAAITFSKLTTIYIGSGVFDDGGSDDTGIATSVQCSNVSGQSAQVRVLVLRGNGVVAASQAVTVAHGSTEVFSTHGTVFSEYTLETGYLDRGLINVESTQSAVFCSAMIADAAFVNNSVALHMVRVNGHPGTVE